jgi:hypothetical protein
METGAPSELVRALVVKIMGSLDQPNPHAGDWLAQQAMDESSVFTGILSTPGPSPVTR